MVSSAVWTFFPRHFCSLLVTTVQMTQICNVLVDHLVYTIDWGNKPLDFCNEPFVMRRYFWRETERYRSSELLTGGNVNESKSSFWDKTFATSEWNVIDARFMWRAHWFYQRAKKNNVCRWFQVKWKHKYYWPQNRNGIPFIYERNETIERKSGNQYLIEPSSRAKSNAHVVALLIAVRRFLFDEQTSHLLS